jgi:hypothetical protein
VYGGKEKGEQGEEEGSCEEEECEEEEVTPAAHWAAFCLFARHVTTS